MSDPGSDDGSESVGYRKPPRHSRFRKGQSGNPSGRPKGSALRSAADRVLNQKVMATENGRKRAVPLTEALLLQLVQRALRGDHRASREVIQIASHLNMGVTDAPEEKPPGIVVSFVDPAGCNPALEALGLITQVDGRYKIAPWAVDAAMARAPRLTPGDADLIRSSTHQPHEARGQRPLPSRSKRQGHLE